MRRVLVLSLLFAIAAAAPVAAQQPLRLKIGEAQDVWSDGNRPQWKPAGTDVDGHDFIAWSDSVNPATPDQLLAMTPAGTIDAIAGPSTIDGDFQAAAASLPDSVLVAWSESQRLMGRIYTRTDAPRTFKITDDLCRIWPHSIAANDGRYVVIAGTQCDGAASGLTLLTLSSDGTMQQSIDLASGVAPTHAAVAAWGSGFVVAWSTSVVICHGDGCGPDRTAVRALRLNRYGTPIDSAPLELQNEEASAGPPAIATSGHSALVFWTDAMSHSLRVSRILMNGDAVDERVLGASAIGSVDAVASKSGVLVAWQHDEAPFRSLMLTRVAVDDLDVEPVGFTSQLATADCTDQAPCSFEPFLIAHASSRATLLYQQNSESPYVPRIAARSLWFARRVHGVTQ